MTYDADDDIMQTIPNILERPMKSATQTFAEIVAADIMESSITDVHMALNGESTESMKFDPTIIVVIVEAIMGIIAMIKDSCPNRRRRVIESAKGPNRLQRARFGAKVHRYLDNCCSPELLEYSGDIATAMIGEAAKATDNELGAIYEEQTDDENWLI